MARPSPSPHKPRRKAKQGANAANLVASVSNVNSAETMARAPAFPLAAFLWPARTSISQWELLPLILMAVGLFRWAAGLWGSSGASPNQPWMMDDGVEAWKD
jgi:alpha-1,3-glucosyltransferase